MQADERAERAAETIWRTWQGGERPPELPGEIAPRDEAEGWAAQAALARLAGPTIGWKLAATSEGGQRHIGVTAPIPGRLFSRFLRAPGELLPAGRNLLRVVEAELAFVLARDLPGEGPHTTEDVLAAVDAVHLAVEVPDTRLERYADVPVAQILADDAYAGLFVLGPEVPGGRELDLAAVETAIARNGEVAERGRGANVLGDPRAALTWLANELPRHGLHLRAGDVVTTGTTTVPVPIAPGDRVEATFVGLGSIAVRSRPDGRYAAPRSAGATTCAISSSVCASSAGGP
ncbi:MAG: fumarylacetoacetate hydrolase family protein [Thermoleophilia bacterium]